VQAPSPSSDQRRFIQQNLNKLALLQSTVPEAFKTLVSLGFENMGSDIIDSHNKEEDLEWGYEMEEKISNSFYSAAHPDDVSLARVTCKQLACEILISNNQNNSDDYLYAIKGLTQQPWWNFNSSKEHSIRGEKDNEVLTYILVTDYELASN
jgi:hypothetical protein